MSDAGHLEAQRRRSRLVLGTIIGLVVLLTAVQVLISQLRFPTPIPSNILIFALVNINIVLLLVLVLLVFRGLFKVYLERRENILGSKFRVKLVVAFVSLALLPAGLLFVVASNLITTSIDSWFNIQVEESLQRALELAQGQYRAAERTALGVAERLARRVAAEGLLLPDAHSDLRGLLQEKLGEYDLEAVQVFAAGRGELAHAARRGGGSGLPATSRLVRRALAGEGATQLQSTSGGDLVWVAVPIRDAEGRVRGALALGTRLAEGMADRAAEVTKGIKEYKQLKMLKNPIKGIYLMLFLSVTLVIIFAATWVGVHLARGITGPIQQLAEGTRAVAAGNLDYRVEVKADDEIGILVDSFNQMTADLRRSKTELEGAYQGLRRSLTELDQRRAYMEAVLETITAGVLSVDRQGRVNTMNQAAGRILGLTPDGRLGSPYATLFADEPLAPVRELLDRASGEGAAAVEQPVSIVRDGVVLNLVVSVSPLRDRAGASQGLVVVLDDVTQLVRAQQALAWREVARRIAHEIKNPLTPIQLSAQRLRKRYAEGGADYERILDECTRTIIQEVDGLKRLVNEFTRYARMPTSDPRPGDLEPAVRQAVQLYAGIGRRIKLGTDLAPELPPVNLDPEQIKRVLINLLDNALAALDNEGEVIVRTRHDPTAGKVILEVADTGTGIPPADRHRLFLPYFSTKKSGTGLGLAIVYRIVAEHGGQIRLEENLPRGTRVLIELPVHSPVGREA